MAHEQHANHRLALLCSGFCSSLNAIGFAVLLIKDGMAQILYASTAFLGNGINTRALHNTMGRGQAAPRAQGTALQQSRTSPAHLAVPKHFLQEMIPGTFT